MVNEFYIAIIADVVKSKEIKERMSFQAKLNNALFEINSTYKEEIASDFTITLGDEFQGVLKSAKVLLDIIYKIESHIYPVKLKVGVGIGEITTLIDRTASIGSDGPAYWSARDALTILKTERKLRDRSIYVEIYENYCDSSINANHINSYIALMELVKKGWKSKQNDLFNYINLNDMLTVDFKLFTLSNALGTSEQNISKMLTRMDYATLNESRVSLHQYVEKVRRELCKKQ